jgi:ABC-type phosphate transport system ATPase subunit
MIKVSPVMDDPCPTFDPVATTRIEELIQLKE